MNMEISQIRLQNLLTLAGGYKKIQDFCEQIGVQPAYFSQLKRGDKAVGNKLARRIEENLGLPPAYMDKQHGVSEDRDNAPDRAAISLAYVIEGLPAVLRERVKSLVLAMAAELGEKAAQTTVHTARIEAKTGLPGEQDSIHGFSINVGKDDEGEGIQAIEKQESSKQSSISNARKANG